MIYIVVDQWHCYGDSIIQYCYWYYCCVDYDPFSDQYCPINVVDVIDSGVWQYWYCVYWYWYCPINVILVLSQYCVILLILLLLLKPVIDNIPHSPRCYIPFICYRWSLTIHLSWRLLLSRLLMIVDRWYWWWYSFIYSPLTFVTDDVVGIVVDIVEGQSQWYHWSQSIDRWLLLLILLSVMTVIPVMTC